jgi:hypothetical protein
LLHPLGIAAADKGVGALAESDAFLAHTVGEPEMLVNVKAGCEWEIRTDADEHAPEAAVVKIKVELIDPTTFELKVAGTVFLANTDEDANWFSRLDDANDLIGARVGEVSFHKFVAPTIRIVPNGNVPVKRTVRNPVLVLIGDVSENITADLFGLAELPEKVDSPDGFLKSLDDGIEQDTIEAAIMEIDVILMVLVEGVHGFPPTVGDCLEEYIMSAFLSPETTSWRHSVKRQKRFEI